jgi:hypothetical protein
LRLDPIAYIPLRLIDGCVEGLNFEFALPVCIRIIGAELPREPVGARHFTHTTSLVLLPVDLSQIGITTDCDQLWG